MLSARRGLCISGTTPTPTIPIIFIWSHRGGSNCIYFVYGWPLRSRSMPSLFIAILILQVILLDYAFRYIPAGCYFLYFPLIGSAAVFPFPQKITLYIAGRRPSRDPFPRATHLFPCGTLRRTTPGRDGWPNDRSLAGIAVPALFPDDPGYSLADPGNRIDRDGSGRGFRGPAGGYSPLKPFKTDLRYVVRPDEHQAWWASRSTRPDRWNNQFSPRPP